VRLVVDEQAAMLAGQRSHRSQVARLGQHDADVGERWLHQDGGDVTVRELALEGSGIVELDDPSCRPGIDWSPHVPCPGRRSSRGGDDERLVHAAVVAVAVDEDLLSLGELADQPDRHRFASVAVRVKLQ
jgi:hypothetical protein